MSRTTTAHNLVRQDMVRTGSSDKKTMNFMINKTPSYVYIYDYHTTTDFNKIMKPHDVCESFLGLVYVKCKYM